MMMPLAEPRDKAAYAGLRSAAEPVPGVARSLASAAWRWKEAGRGETVAGSGDKAGIMRRMTTLFSFLSAGKSAPCALA